MTRNWRLLVVLWGILLIGGGVGLCADLKSLLEPVPGVMNRKPETAGQGPAFASGSLAVLGEGGSAPASLILTEAELSAAIEMDLPKRFPFKGELKVRLARPWTPMRLPGQDFFAECVQIPPGGLASSMQLIVRGVSAGKIVGEWPLLVRAELWQEVWVASQRLDRGQLLSPAVIVPQRVDLLKESAQPLPADTELSGFELAQTVQQGRPLSKRDLVERSLVRKGQFVDAVAKEGGLSIRMRAMALEGGAAGTVIRVKNLDSNKEFVGQVINENQVQVRF
ncbi:MAG: hypothetical protein RLZZ142_234 [Verrucomicrobiota bacterium]|jgi:flagella basal body P-ring formation protein FlgA